MEIKQKIDLILKKKNELLLKKKKLPFIFILLFAFSLFLILYSSLFIQIKIEFVIIFYSLLVYLYNILNIYFFEDSIFQLEIDKIIEPLISYKNISLLEENINFLEENNLLNNHFIVINSLFTDEDLFYFLIGSDLSFPNIKKNIINNSYPTNKLKILLINNKTESFIKSKYNTDIYPLILDYLLKNDFYNKNISTLKDLIKNE